MSDEPDTTDTMRDEPTAGSVWAQLRDEHQEIAERERDPLVLDVPGYNGLLRIRYRYVPLHQTEKATQRVSKVKGLTDKALASSAATLALACDEILARQADDPRADADGYAPLCAPGEPPIRFDHALCAGMGWATRDSRGKAMSAEQIVRRLFGGSEGDYTLIRQAEQVSEWIAEGRDDTAEEFLGK